MYEEDLLLELCHMTKNMNPMKSLKKQVEKNNRRLKICGNRTSNK
jgi:hypothetical protein